MSKTEMKQWSFDNCRAALVAVFGLAPDATVADFDRTLKKLSSYEKGVILARALDDGYWPSLRTMADDLCYWFKLVRLADLVALGRLPSVYLEAFERPSLIRLAWISGLKRLTLGGYGMGLTQMMAKKIKAERLAGQEWPARRVYEALTNPGDAFVTYDCERWQSGLVTIDRQVVKHSGQNDDEPLAPEVACLFIEAAREAGVSVAETGDTTPFVCIHRSEGPEPWPVFVRMGTRVVAKFYTV